MLATFFQIFDIWWSSLDIMDDFKLISRTVIFRLGEINNIMIFSFVKKIFFSLFLVRYYISNYKKKYFKFFFSKLKKKILGKNFLKIFFFNFEKIFWIFFFYNWIYNNELKKVKKKFFLTKLKIMMFFISPKRKITVLEMSLKSSIMSKLDHQMSKV